MAPKKNSKVVETSPPIVDVIETSPPIVDVVEPTKKSKSKKALTEKVSETDNHVIKESIVKSTKEDKPEEVKTNKKTKKEINSVEDKPEVVNTDKKVKTKKEAKPVEEDKPEEVKTDKKVKPKKEAKPEEVKTDEIEVKPEEVKTDKKVKPNKKEPKTDEVKQDEIKIEVKPNPTTSEYEESIKQELELTKKSWLNIVDKIHDINQERDKLELEKNKIVKTLKELLDKLQIDDKQIKGFNIDNKVSLVSPKNDIIHVDSDSTSDNDSNSDSDSESEDEPTLLLGKTPKNKSKTLIKTTKGNTKNLKLSIKDDSDSD